MLAQIKNLLWALFSAVAFSMFAGQAFAVTVLFTGKVASGGSDKGVIGHDFVPTATVNQVIPAIGSFYSTLGVAGPCTALSKPDPYDFTSVREMAIGANLHDRCFGATSPAALS
ncbi:MAG: hypothetical protein EVA87_03760 [Rhodospirillaceae bacterium]|nr:hypothetical protein [Rhodospirillaceae bacterium]RPG02832.1 MAG: hypothetical protein CBC23_002960 [Rhodospirillaceae bacterium TMED63]RZO38092.1 MAG: hypothetical protein EVA87_03760 [Rhodospirillaceae bacterium]